MINRSVIVGRLTKDVDLRRTNNGTVVASFNLACNRSFQSADGQEADFIPCVCWNKLAENVDTYCSKGSLVGVEGRLRSRSYDNAQGQKVFVVELVCDSVQFLDSKKDNQSNQVPVQNYSQPQQYQQSQQQQSYGANQMQSNSFDSFNIMEDDIQF